MKDLKTVAVIGLGLLGGSIASGILRCFSGVKVTGYAHRPATAAKAMELAVVSEVADSIENCVQKADIVVIATPLSVMEKIFEQIKDSLPAGCIVTDVGSTKVQLHRWANSKLPGTVYYVGSHPIAGSEQQGVEFARDDLLDKAICILTATKNTHKPAVQKLEKFWTHLGCSIQYMKPAEHDRIYANVSHVPHITAAALINATEINEMLYAGKGFIDTSRIASGPGNIWSDVLLTNKANSIKGIDKVIAELKKMKKEINGGNKQRLEKLLETARLKREALIEYKIKHKELL